MLRMGWQLKSTGLLWRGSWGHLRVGMPWNWINKWRIPFLWPGPCSAREWPVALPQCGTRVLSDAVIHSSPPPISPSHQLPRETLSDGANHHHTKSALNLLQFLPYSLPLTRTLNSRALEEPHKNKMDLKTFRIKNWNLTMTCRYCSKVVLMI